MQDKINYRQIENAFQETVSRLFAEGYNICTRTMGGSQGEIAKVDLLRGNSFARVELDRWNHGFYDFGFAIRIGRMDASEFVSGSLLDENDPGTMTVFGSRLEWEEVHAYKSLLRESHLHLFTEFAA